MTFWGSSLEDFWNEPRDNTEFLEKVRMASKSCNSCGEQDLHWKQTPDGWRLHTAAGVMHDCPARKSGGSGTKDAVFKLMEKDHEKVYGLVIEWLKENEPAFLYESETYQDF